MMENPHIAYGLLNIAGGILFMALGVPLALRKVGMNHLYGFRFKASLRSDEAWFMINGYGGRQLIFWSAVMVLFGAGCFFLPAALFSDRVIAAGIGIGPSVLSSLIVSVRTLLYARRL
jgi:hypothetical protein